MGSNPSPFTFSVSPKAQAKTASELSKSMESMRGHLQAQLRCKEAENSRLCMQIKVPAGPTGGEDGGSGLAGQGRRPGQGCHIQEGFAPKDYGAAAAKELALQRDSGTMARAVDLEVFSALPRSDWVGFHAPEPVTSSLSPQFS